MECNKEEALRARDIAEKKIESRDFTGARKFALKAQRLFPDLENIAQMLVVCDVHCSSEQKLFGDEMDWYEILQLEQTADDATIKKQYRKFALQLHPDKNKFAGAEAAFKLIGEAQRVLLDREKRSQLDMKRRVPTSKPAMPRQNQQKAPMNFNSATKTNNVKPNFTNSKAQQQRKQQQQRQQEKQQEKQQAKQQQNGSRPTFWTVCPFCSVKYQYYKEVLNKSLRCQHCQKPFIACEFNLQGTPPAANSSQQAFDQQKDGLNGDASKAGPYVKKGSTSVSRTPNGKRKRNQVAESSQSSDKSSSDSEGDKFAEGGDGFPGVENHSTYAEEQPRRSSRQKRNGSSYKGNTRNYDDDLLRRSKSGHGETTEVKDQNGFAADLKDEHEGLNKRVRGKEAVGGSKQMGGTSEHSTSDPTSKPVNHPNVYLYPDAEFSDFDKGRKRECFAAGQIWAIYDTIDSMPRFYALIRKVLSPEFKLQITWFDPRPDDSDEINWVKAELPVACGKYKLGDTDITDDHLMFSHLVTCERVSRSINMYPRKGETWALFKNWDIKWYMHPESHKQYEFEFVEILSDYVEGEGVCIAYISKLKGFVSLFRITKEANQTFQIPPRELFRFSHRVPHFKMTGQEGVGVHKGSYELDPASLPLNLEETAVPENFDVKISQSPSYRDKKRSSERPKLVTSDGVASIPKVNSERSNLAENKGSVDGIYDLRATPAPTPDPMEIPDTQSSPALTPDPIEIPDTQSSPASTPDPIEIPDTQFFNFDSRRSLEKFQIGQIWAFYSDEDGLPKYYGQINKIETSPDLELHVYWLTCCSLPENTVKWEDEDVPISCGRFNVRKTAEFLNVYNDTSSISHQVHADAVVQNKRYAIFPKKSEVWALYRNWSSEIKSSDLKNWEYDIVEVLGETDVSIEVLVLEHVTGFSSVFRPKSNEGSSVNLRIISKKQLLRFSHQIPAFKLTEEEHGNLRGFWELDPGALPAHYYRV